MAAVPKLCAARLCQGCCKSMPWDESHVRSGGYWVRQMRQSPSKTAHTVLTPLQMFLQRTILIEDLFFLENTMIFGEKSARRDQNSFSFLLKINYLRSNFFYQKFLHRSKFFLTKSFPFHVLRCFFVCFFIFEKKAKIS